MLLLLYFSNLLLASNAQVTEPGTLPEGLEDVVNKSYDSKDFWKLIFTTYYDMKGLRNETTDTIVEAFFEHKFEAYPIDLYPSFKRILEYISKSNDRIWNFYESILYLYHNVAAADRIYETVLRRDALGKLLQEFGEPDTDATVPTDERSKLEFIDLKRRSGVIGEEQLFSDWYEQPCGLDCGVEPLQIGSIRAIPGIHFPNYEDIPITSFTCAGKRIPGFYADLETGCQVFHVCYPHRRESFLCPIGTTFNQAILACDYWYSSNCSLAPLYFYSSQLTAGDHLDGKESFVDHLLGQYGTLDTISTSTRRPVDSHKKPGKPKSPQIKIVLPNIDWSLMIKFLPIKSKITECPDFCEETTPAYPIESTTDAVPIVAKYPETTTTTTRPIIMTPATPTVSHKKEKHDEKTAKSEILLDILKAVEVLTKDAEGFLTEMVQKKRDHNLPSGIKASTELPKVEPAKSTRPPQLLKEPKPFPVINQRFVVKPASSGRKLQRPTTSPSKLLKPSKRWNRFQKKEPAKLILEGMKAISHLFD